MELAEHPNCSRPLVQVGDSAPINPLLKGFVANYCLKRTKRLHSSTRASEEKNVNIGFISHNTPDGDAP